MIASGSSETPYLSVLQTGDRPVGPKASSLFFSGVAAHRWWDAKSCLSLRPERAAANAQGRLSRLFEACRLTYVKVRRPDSTIYANLNIIGYVSHRTRDNRR